jgi:hypothetical protein
MLLGEDETVAVAEAAGAVDRRRDAGVRAALGAFTGPLAHLGGALLFGELVAAALDAAATRRRGRGAGVGTAFGAVAQVLAAFVGAALLGGDDAVAAETTGTLGGLSAGIGAAFGTVAEILAVLGLAVGGREERAGVALTTGTVFRRGAGGTFAVASVAEVVAALVGADLLVVDDETVGPDAAGAFGQGAPGGREQEEAEKDGLRQAAREASGDGPIPSFRHGRFPSSSPAGWRPTPRFASAWCRAAASARM